jgi:hypothetical protein
VAETWPRPVPLVGDATSASQRAADPTGWAMGEPVREALHRVVGARRDVRRFRPDPVPAEVLERVLSAAHAAPSVGHSQPWSLPAPSPVGVAGPRAAPSTSPSTATMGLTPGGRSSPADVQEPGASR